MPKKPTAASKTKKSSSRKPRASSPSTPGLISTPAAKAMAVQEERWRAESDLRTLQEAEMIRRDPKRMRTMQKLADEQMKALEKIKKA